jgi:hypothetical protein
MIIRGMQAERIQADKVAAAGRTAVAARPSLDFRTGFA